MIIKKYIVNNMNEAVTRIRYELGKDAVIISQRRIRKKGFAGLFSKKVMEVTAAVDNDTKNSKKVENKEFITNSDPMKDSLAAIKKAINKHKDNGREHLEKIAVAEGKKDTGEDYNNFEVRSRSENDLISEMREMKSMLSSMANNGGNLFNGKSELYKTLRSYDLKDELIEEIISRVSLDKSDIDEDEKLKKILGDMLSVSEVKDHGVMVLVGPTGVGKTTTIAKLAGRFALIEKKKVGLITVDTYRIGAVDQLRTYADIMNIPFEVVFSIKDMETAVESMKNCDIVLVDTTGRSSKNKMQISELRAFIDRTHSDNLHLVMSCTTKNSDIKSIVEGYKVLNYNNIIITKFDETTTYGSILNILNEAKKPLSYVSVGQNVPDDIKRLDINEIINLVTGVDNVC